MAGLFASARAVALNSPLRPTFILNNTTPFGAASAKSLAGLSDQRSKTQTYRFYQKPLSCSNVCLQLPENFCQIALLALSSCGSDALGDGVGECGGCAGGIPGKAYH